MTREEARKVSKALEDIEMFEFLMDEIDGVIGDYMDQCDLIKFSNQMKNFLNEELERRKAVLAKI